MELRLVVEPDGPGDVVREVRRLGERRRESEVRGGGRLGAERVDVVGRRRVHVGRQPLESTVDAERVDAGLDGVDGGLVGFRVLAGPLVVERRGEIVVEEAVLGGEFRGRVAGGALGDPVGLEDRHRLPGRRQPVRGRQAGDAAADHDCVHLESIRQRGIVGLRRRRQPQRLGGSLVRRWLCLRLLGCHVTYNGRRAEKS